jgi:hypothetical protein
MPKKDEVIVAAQQVLRRTSKDFQLPARTLYGAQAMTVLLAVIRQQSRVGRRNG